MLIRDHMVDVPLDWSTPEGETIRVFAREVCDPARRRETLPLLAFLQGGPGGKSPRPSNGGPPWLAEALKTHRVILIDQRGTGRSSRI
ncbi:proline iminopeptidase, partial [Rhizobium ruizarguesonis]